jgi:hypothetical protein
VCVSATTANATRGIAEEILQFNKMWLEFRQQVAVGLSSVCGTKVITDNTTVACAM